MGVRARAAFLRPRRVLLPPAPRSFHASEFLAPFVPGCQSAKRAVRKIQPMRVIAGEARGRRLSVPRGLAVRPSGARLRESAFGILEHRGAIRGARVLDLFAGSGALGIEALSRGAASVVALEHDRVAGKVIRANAGHCGFADRHELQLRSVTPALAGLAEGVVFDLVFLDPPYGKVDIDAILVGLVARELLEEGAFVLIEHPHGNGPSAEGLELELERRYGGSEISLLRRKSA
ncbi:MAG: 16S rRNA (guanine(966)-N(2))-methyltransferase RsmD [Deltaproteobacteria bacterium]